MQISTIYKFIDVCKIITHNKYVYYIFSHLNNGFFMNPTQITDPQQLITALKASLIIAAFAPINTALANVQANPTAENVVAQVYAAKGNLVAILPGLQNTGIADIAQLAQNKLAAVEASLTTPASA